MDVTEPTLVVVSWSGGKDSALALHAMMGNPTIKVRSLVTTVTEEFERISMHGVRLALLREQCASIGIPLVEVGIPPRASNAEYEAAMIERLESLRQEGVQRVVFGDLYLRDVREYRERLVSRSGLEPVFPLWMHHTGVLARRFTTLGFRALVVCVDPARVDASFCGREYDARLLRDLPPGVDACGENGEFHTFVYDGPFFRAPLAIERGDVVERDGFLFIDLVPASSGQG